MTEKFDEFIKTACDNLGIKCTFLSKKLVTMLEKDGQTRFVFGRKFDLNGHGVGGVLDDKYAFFEVLKAKKIPVVEHTICYAENDTNDYAKDCKGLDFVLDYFKKHDRQIVLKPNHGTCGKGVTLVKDEKDIQPSLERLFKENSSISLSPYYDAQNEYRLILLDGKVQIMYAKCLPKVEGDGKSSVRQLLIKFNPSYFNGKMLDDSYDRVLKKGESFTYNWKFNLSQGATTKPVEDERLRRKLIRIAKRVVDACNLKFVSVDIIRTKDEKLLVLEANSGIMVDNFVKINPDQYDRVEKMYCKALKIMFDMK